MLPDHVGPASGRQICTNIVNIARTERAQVRSAVGGLTWVLLVFTGLPVAAAPIGMSSTPPALVTTAQVPADAEVVSEVSAEEGDPSGSFEQDLRPLPIRSDSIDPTLAHGFLTGVSSSQVTGSALQSPSFTLRPFADPRLNMTIAPNGTLSFTSGGDDLLTTGSTRFGTGEARGSPTGEANGLFAVFLRFEPTAGVLSGPFGNDATFTELYSALEEYDPVSSQEGRIARTLRATFP